MAEAGTATTTGGSGPSDYMRLHISPLNPTLLAAIVPPSILPAARNISYHSVQTFSEKGYGYIDLPEADAEKIRKKYQGAILKGTKIKIEKARPVREVPRDDPDPTPPRPKLEKSMTSKKRKRHDDVLPGAELRDRHVKRGWTDPITPKRSEKRSKGPKKESVRSKYTTGPECLFKTTLPANVAAASKDAVADAKSERRSKRHAGKEAVIHEFAKTTKYATFLRSNTGSSNTKSVKEYVEGKGWVDEDGNVIEPEVESKRPPVVEIAKASTSGSKANKEEDESSDESDASDSTETKSNHDISNHDPSPQTTAEDSETSNSGASESSSEEDDVSSVDAKMQNPATRPSDTSSSGTSSDEDDADDTSSSGSDSSSEGSDDEDEEEEEDSKSESLEDSETPRPTSSSTQPNLSISIPNAQTTNKTPSEVHPLEALFKRRQPDADEPKLTESAPSFSFFGDYAGDVDASDNDQEASMNSIPMTPFTQHDFINRGLRSAAPTPDTAHANKRFDAWPSDNAYDDDADAHPDPTTPLTGRKIRFEEEAESGNTAEGTKSQEQSDPAAASEFQKWFYENRGEANRAWKKRRKTAAKEKRQRENRKRGEQRT